MMSNVTFLTPSSSTRHILPSPSIPMTAASWSFPAPTTAPTAAAPSSPPSPGRTSWSASRGQTPEDRSTAMPAPPRWPRPSSTTPPTPGTAWISRGTTVATSTRSRYRPARRTQQQRCMRQKIKLKATDLTDCTACVLCIIDL